MKNVELVEHTQVQAVLDCTLNLYTSEALEIMVDVLSDEQFKALALTLDVIQNISQSLVKKIEKEGKA